MKLQNLILISYDFPPLNGGIARLCHEIVIGMQDYYKEIIVITSESKYVTSPYKETTCKIVRLPNQRIKRELAAFKYLFKIKHKNNYTVLCGVWHPEALLVYLSGFKNVFVLGHGTEFLYGTSKFRKYIWLPVYAKWLLGKVSKIITNSDYTLELVKKINISAKAEALPLAVNHHFFKPLNTEKKSNKLVLSTVSRILQFKGYDFILKTLENLPLSLIDQIEWHIAGTGSYLEEFKVLVEKSRVKNLVIINGFVKDEDLPNFYNNSDVFILATRESKESTQVEGFGLVFLEAQACGVPVIGTNTGGIPSAVKHENGGWLIEQDNMDELLNILKKILETPSIIKEQGLRARRRVEENCTWSIYCQQLFQILNHK